MFGKARLLLISECPGGSQHLHPGALHPLKRLSGYRLIISLYLLIVKTNKEKLARYE
nr:MAG TPA: hypothetical protein [Caudoviricetes sp.]